jgi:hypothetical protein
MQKSVRRLSVDERTVFYARHHVHRSGWQRWTAGPDGRRVDLQDRLADIHARHANEDADLFAARMSRVPLLVAAVERVERRMAGLPHLKMLR